MVLKIDRLASGTRRIPIPKGQWDVVLADPPWRYYGAQDKWGAAEKFYKTIPDAKMLLFPMRKILKEQSILFLWATSPRLDFAIECISEWKLHYRGVAFVWVKTKRDGTPIGAQGVRPSIVKPLTEFVLCASPVATGRPLKLADESIAQTVFASRRTHSEKPDEVQDRIEQMYPEASKLELFARHQRPGWDVWGDEI